jgi:hypothetical protein
MGILTGAHPFAEPKLRVQQLRPDGRLQWLCASHHIPVASHILTAPFSCARPQRPAQPQHPTREHTLLPRAPTHPQLSSAAEPVRGTARLPGSAATTHAVRPARANTRPARRRTSCAVRPVPVRAGLWSAAGGPSIWGPPAGRVQRGDAVVPSAPGSVPRPGRVWRPGPWHATSLRQQSCVLGERGVVSSGRKRLVCLMTRPGESLDRPSDRSNWV